MLQQNEKRITHSKLITITISRWIILPYIYTMNNTYQDTKNLNHKTYRNQKIKIANNSHKITHKPRHRLDLEHRTIYVPKPYRKTENGTVRNSFANEKINEYSRKTHDIYVMIKNLNSLDLDEPMRDMQNSIHTRQMPNPHLVLIWGIPNGIIRINLLIR